MDPTAVRRAWDEDGFIVVDAVLDPGECAAFKRESAATRAALGDQERTVYVGLAATNPAFHSLVAHPRILAALAPVMDDGVAFLSDKLVFKSAAKPFPTPWHIDVAYWPRTRPKLSVWLALDDVGPEDGALTVVRGSHRRAMRVTAGDVTRTNREFERVVAHDWDPADERAVPIPRGAAIVFSDRLVHGSRPATSGRDRWAWIGTYHAPAADEPFDLDFPARRDLVPARARASGQP